MDASESNVIRASSSQYSLHSISRGTSAAPLIDVPMHQCEIRRRSPTPSPRCTPSPSPCPSPRTPEATLSLPPTNTRPDSRASSVTLKDSPVLEDGPNTILDGPLTAEPGNYVAPPGDVTGGNEQTSEEDKELYLAEAPVSFFRRNRYECREKIPRDQERPHTSIPAMSSIPRRGKAGRWEPVVHPEGSLYFRYENFFTNIYLYDPMNLRYTDKTVETLCAKIEEHPGIKMADTEIGIHFYIDDDGDYVGCYYLCDIVNEEVYWLLKCPEEFVTNEFPDVRILSREHLSHALQSQFWEHTYMFPDGRNLSQEKLHSILGDISYLLFDRRTSPTTTAAWNDEDLHYFMQICKELLNANSDGRPSLAQHVVTLARLNSFLLMERFIRYHGERYAQLESDHSVLEDEPEKLSWWFKCATWLFFFTPRTHLERLRKVWVDRMVNQTIWSKMVDELQEDLAESITPSTVILTANVSFLAIQSIDTGSSNRSAGQIISYISTLLSLGNIFACTILARQHKPSRYRRCEEAAQYLLSRTRSSHGLEKLAVVMSIPTACFLWALLTFFMAICWVCFYSTSVTTRISIGIALLVFAMLLASVVHNGNWEPPKGFEVLRDKMERTKALVKKVKRVPTLKTMGKKIRTFSVDAMKTLSPKRSKKTRKSTGSTSLKDRSAPQTPEKEDTHESVSNRSVRITVDHTSMRDSVESGGSRPSLERANAYRSLEGHPSAQRDRMRNSLEGPNGHGSLVGINPFLLDDNVHKPPGSDSRPRLPDSGSTRHSPESGSTAVSSHLEEARRRVENMV